MKFLSDLAMAAVAVSATLVALSSSSPAAAQPATDPSTLPTEQPAGPEPTVIAAHEQVLRKVIADLKAKTPDYDSMVPELGAIVRANVDAIADAINKLGPLKTLTYVGTQQQALKFRAAFEKGNETWFIVIQPDGKIAGLVFRDETPPPAS
jgi:hypothetical protein